MPLLKRRSSKTIAGMVAEVIGHTDKVELDSSTSTYYTIQCSKDGKTWTVDKRYSQFHAFQLDIKDQVTRCVDMRGFVMNVSMLGESPGFYSSLWFVPQVEIEAPFPPKLAKISSLSPAQKEERRSALDAWASSLLKQPVLSSVVAQV